MTLEKYVLYRVRHNPRESYEGRPLKEACKSLTGQEMTLEAMWQMDESDPYPGEWAMGDPDWTRHLWETAGISWVASGDVEILGRMPG